MKALENTFTVIVLFSLLIASLLYTASQFGYSPIQPQSSFGSAVVGNDYHATGTAPYEGIVEDRLIKGGYGSLGSVIVTKAGDAEFALYDATSTAALNADNFASSTQHIATFPASLAVGTYVFDVEFNDGLVLEVVTGDTGTSTITYR